MTGPVASHSYADSYASRICARICLARHHRVEAAGDAEQVAGGELAAVDVEHRLEPLGGVARQMAEAVDRRLPHRIRIGADHVELAPIAGREADGLGNGGGGRQVVQKLPAVVVRRQPLAHGERGARVVRADQDQLGRARHRSLLDRASRELLELPFERAELRRSG